MEEQDRNGRLGKKRIQEVPGILKEFVAMIKETSTGGSTRRWGENDAPTVNRSPRVDMVNREQVWDPGEIHYSRRRRRRTGKEQRFGGGGGVGSASRTSEDQSSTDPGGGGSLPIKERVPPWQMPEDDGGSSRGKVDDQEFPWDAEDGQKGHRIGRSR